MRITRFRSTGNLRVRSDAYARDHGMTSEQMRDVDRSCLSGPQKEDGAYFLVAPSSFFRIWFFLRLAAVCLEQIPQRLVVDSVMKLHFGALDDCSQLARRTVGGSLLQIDIAALHISP